MKTELFQNQPHVTSELVNSRASQILRESIKKGMLGSIGRIKDSRGLYLEKLRKVGELVSKGYTTTQISKNESDLSSSSSGIEHLAFCAGVYEREKYSELLRAVLCRLEEKGHNYFTGGFEDKYLVSDFKEIVDKEADRLNITSKKEAYDFAKNIVKMVRNAIDAENLRFGPKNGYYLAKKR